MYLWLLGRPQIQNILPPPQAENIDVCLNMAPMLTDNKKRRKKKLATILNLDLYSYATNPPPPTDRACLHILTAALSHKDIWCVWSAFASVIYHWVTGVNSKVFLYNMY